MKIKKLEELNEFEIQCDGKNIENFEIFYRFLTFDMRMSSRWIWRKKKNLKIKRNYIYDVI